MSFLRDIRQEAIGVIVHDELVGEVRLLEQWPDEAVVGYGKADVGIAAEDDWHLVALAEAQYLEVVPDGCVLVANGVEATVVNLEEGSVSLAARTIGSKRSSAAPSPGCEMICVQGLRIAFIMPWVFSSMVPPSQHSICMPAMRMSSSL